MTNFTVPSVAQIPLSAIRAMQKTILTLESNGNEVVKLTQGMPAFDTPEHIKAACMEALARGETLYGHNLGLPLLRDAVANKLYHDNGLRYSSADEIMITNGVSQGIFLALSAFLAPDDEVLLCEPTFPPYLNGVAICGGKVVQVATYAEHHYLPQIEDIEAALTAKSKILVLINPVNPTGAVYDEKHLEQIAQLAIAEDLLVIADEIYEKIIFDGAEHHSIAKFAGMRERTIVLNGFSKAYAMTGWRLGYIATDAKLMHDLLKVQQNSDVCANSFAQYGAVAALTGPQSSCEQMVEQLNQQRQLLCDGLKNIPQLRFNPPQGALYVYAKLRGIELDARTFCEQLLSHSHVAIVPWNASHLRISFVAPAVRLKQGISKLRDFIEHV